jgi:hypothetical protein
MNQDELKEKFIYDPETGDFVFKSHVFGGKNNAFLMARQGDKAGGTRHTTGYWYLSVKGKRYAAHRMAFLYMTGEVPSCDVDHINGDRCDNSWKNLRIATRAENMQNLKESHTDNRCGFLGVEKHRKRFVARICVGGKRKYLGAFNTPEEAHSRYLEAKRYLHPWGTL